MTEQLLDKWIEDSTREFFELNEDTVATVLSAFHDLLADAQVLPDLDYLKLVSQCAEQIQLPVITSLTAEEVKTYTDILNALLPNFASESEAIRRLSLAFIPRLSKVLTRT